MSYTLVHRCLALLAVCIGLLFAAHGGTPGWAQDTAPTKTDAALIAAWQIKLDGAEIAISNGADLTAAQVDDTKQALDQVLSEAQALQSRGQARLGPLKAELASLGAAPEDTAPPEDAKVADSRTRLQQELSAIQGRMSQAQLATVRAQNLLADVGRLEQGRMTARMLTRGPTPLKPKQPQSAKRP
jgi:small-conductance mechanosensitive channel